MKRYQLLLLDAAALIERTGWVQPNRPETPVGESSDV